MASYKIDADGKRTLVHATKPPKPRTPAAKQPAKTVKAKEDKDNG